MHNSIPQFFHLPCHAILPPGEEIWDFGTFPKAPQTMQALTIRHWAESSALHTTSSQPSHCPSPPPHNPAIVSPGSQQPQPLSWALIGWKLPLSDSPWLEESVPIRERDERGKERHAWLDEGCECPLGWLLTEWVILPLGHNGASHAVVVFCGQCCEAINRTIHHHYHHHHQHHMMVTMVFFSSPSCWPKQLELMSIDWHLLMSW